MCVVPHCRVLCCVGVLGMFVVMKNALLLSLQLLRGGIWACMSMALLGLGMGTMLAYFHICGIMLVLREVSNMLVMNASPMEHMYFRCMMFSLSGPCELLFLLSLIASWT